MALFNKLFASHKKKNLQNADTTASYNTKNSIFPFSNEQVRIVLYRECDLNGRRLLFDSSAIQKVNLAATTLIEDGEGNEKNQKNYIDISNGYGYRYARPDTDYNSIGEMIFGSVAMSFRGTSLKVHWLRSPNRILCSQVFLSPTSPNGHRRSSANNTGSDLNSFDTSSLNSFTLSLSLCLSDNSSSFPLKKQTNPLDVPESVTTESSAGTRSFDFSDSGYCGTDPWNTSLSSYGPRSTRSSMASIYSMDQFNSRKFSIDSSINPEPNGNERVDGGLHRRIMRNISTSFENNLSGSDVVGFFGDSVQQNGTSSNFSNRRRYSDQTESRSNPEMIRSRKGSSKECLRPPPPHFSSYTSRTKSSARRSKIGLAICITFTESMEEEMQLFCSEHIALFESMLCRLRATAESAYVNQKRFHQVMLHAWISTTAWITDLFTAPRLYEPIWLTLSSGAAENPSRLAQKFMTELSSLLSSADTKDTNFFISTLLTAILTNHLGWVATVAPLSTSSANGSTDVVKQMQSKISEVSKFHPYNALWAQLSDLYGAIGNPTKISKTIVCGNETMIVNKLLNVLTYFIRCGEIRRAAECEVMEYSVIKDILRGMNKTDLKSQTKAVNRENGKVSIGKGLSRTATCLRDLTFKADEDRTVMNDIPNVLAYRDSRFVRQELRIGNYLMDTGIEMAQQQKQRIHEYKARQTGVNGIKVMVQDIEEVECETAAEAIDYDAKNGEDLSSSLSKLITANSLGGSKSNTVKLFWGIEPVREGVTEKQWQHFQRKPQTSIDVEGNLNKTFPEKKTKRSTRTMNELKRSKSLVAKSSRLRKRKGLERTMQESMSYDSENWSHENGTTLKAFSSLSDLITANSVGVSDRLVWGIERVKEGVCLEEEQHFEIAQKRIEREHDINLKSNVVFMLGDNEILSGLKNSPSPSVSPSSSGHHTFSEYGLDSAATLQVPSCSSTPAAPATTVNLSTPVASSGSTLATPNGIVEKKKKCNHKKHSGVKFNFEQYPQIVTNYMKNKNLDLANYDFLEKGLKLEGTFGAGSSMFPPPPLLLNDTKIEEEEEEETCECCANSSRILQTPSNATELEFSSDDNNYPTSPVLENHTTGSVGRKMSMDKTLLKDCCHDENANERKEENTNPDGPKALETNVINLPISKSQNSTTVIANKPGFVPSLFVGMTDHYISDMVLQGTSAPLSSWESSLKQNLALSSHCATFEQLPTENIAIIANVDTWDVKLISSQSYVLPSGSGTSGPVGMSQLVSTMLETVHAMWAGGTSAYQCMSFLESKLHEMYLRSETLAAFLLATEFCSLNSVTSALNLSANDVPLLLSVASIHSPQVTKKYGVSFR